MEEEFVIPPEDHPDYARFHKIWEENYGKARPGELPFLDLLDSALQELKSLTKDQLIKMIENRAHDWQALNRHHNDRAIAYNWCGVYESHQYHYNRGFRVMRLIGRDELRMGTVNVRVL